ncbi:MAG: outer membrane lipoprotein chaperone LolA [Candidatus Symbiodolus clandestinus]
MRLIKRVLSLLLWCWGVPLVIADGASELQLRLQRIKHFSADFVQTVTDQDNQLLQTSQGKIWLQRPSRFHWQINSPEEMLVVSDGNTLWMYLPELQQVTATRLNEALDNTPWILISSNRPTDWRRYQIQQQGNQFMITPRRPGSLLQKFAISVTRQGIIQWITFVECQGSRSQFLLKNYRCHPIPAQQFIFKCPSGVTVDDQR